MIILNVTKLIELKAMAYFFAKYKGSNYEFNYAM